MGFFRPLKLHRKGKEEEKVSISTEKKRKTVTIDETVVKAGRKCYYVHTAIDVERKIPGIIQQAKPFIKENCKWLS